MQINNKFLPIVLALVIGVVMGVALQRFLPVGTIIRRTVDLVTTRPFGGAEPSPTALTASKTESQERVEQARLKSQINRDAYQRVIHFYGDSIGRGRGLAVSEDPNPLSRIEDTAQLLLQDNGVSPRELYVRYAWEQDLVYIQQDLASGMIRDNDIILYEDAGQHEEDVELRRQRFEKIEKVVRDSGRKVQLVFTTMFDYQPASGFYNSNYDALVGNSGMTMNQVVETVTASGNSSLLDWNKQMDEAMVALTPYGVSPMLPDGVHPNIFGNVLLAATIVKYVGVPLNNYQSVKEAFQNLPKNYEQRLDWKKPLDPRYLDPALRALLEIADNI